jgi:hypothetical protein
MAAKERPSAVRERLAYEAARILLDQGSGDYERARRKAAERLGVTNRRQWPTNDIIQDALLAQRRLFLGDKAVVEIDRLRRTALEAMARLDSFSPRLIGGALHGVVSAHPRIELLLFADRVEEVIFTLIDLGIPWRTGERLMRYPSGQRETHPTLAFVAGDLDVELIVLPPRGLRDPPLDPVTERPQRGADREALQRLIAQAGEGCRDVACSAAGRGGP